MGSYKLVITDFEEEKCNVRNCDSLANQYKITVIKNRAKVEKYCYTHQDLISDD